MTKTNTTRMMSMKMIEKSFNEMMYNGESEMLIDFINNYPTFTEKYIELLLKKISIINKVVSKLRENE